MDRPIKKQIRGIDVIYIKSKKFKTITWSFVFTHAPGTLSINEYYFLSNILVDNMKKYPTFVKKYRYLSSLYGLDAFSNAMAIGKNIINQFVVTYPNERYIPQETDLSEKAFIFLNEIITNPKMREGHLTRKVLVDSLDEAKQSFRILQSVKDMYAYYRFSEETYKDMRDLQYNFPDNLRLGEVTLESLMAAYQRLLDGSHVELYVTGNVEEERIEAIIQAHLSDKIKSQDIVMERRHLPALERTEPRRVIEYGDVSQARLFFGFRTSVDYFTKDHAAMSIFNDIFGGFDQSKLFIDIREESHLAYYVDAHYLPEENLIVVPVICDFDQTERVIEKITKALDEIIAGDFSDALFNQAKTNALNAIASIGDSQPIYLLQHIKTYHLFNERYDLERRFNAYRHVTREDIIRVAKTLVADTIYIYTKKGNQDD